MTACDQGNIVLIPFPFTDLSSVKQRPALIISSRVTLDKRLIRKKLGALPPVTLIRVLDEFHRVFGKG